MTYKLRVRDLNIQWIDKLENLRGYKRAIAESHKLNWTTCKTLMRKMICEVEYYSNAKYIWLLNDLLRGCIADVMKDTDDVNIRFHNKVAGCVIQPWLLQ